MQPTPWMRMSSLYEWDYVDIPENIRVRRRPEATDVLAKAGVYLIADTRLPTTWHGEQLIYVGVAGGRGTGSDFHARIHKHALKAMNATVETVTGSAITDTRRWRAYRDAHLGDHNDLSSILGGWMVRLLVLPNETEGDRSTIMLTEQVVALAFDRNLHARDHAPRLPRCNDQRLADRLINLLQLSPDEATWSAGPDEDRAVQQGYGEIPLDLNQWDDMAFDEEFAANLGGDASLQDLYRQILARVDEVCVSPEGQAAGLTIHYRQAGRDRDLRVAWQVEQPRKNVLRVTTSRNGFNVWAHADPAQLAVQGVTAQPSMDPLRSKFRVGGFDGGPVSWVGTALRVALTNR